VHIYKVLSSAESSLVLLTWQNITRMKENSLQSSILLECIISFLCTAIKISQFPKIKCALVLHYK